MSQEQKSDLEADGKLKRKDYERELSRLLREAAAELEDLVDRVAAALRRVRHLRLRRRRELEPRLGAVGRAPHHARVIDVLGTDHRVHEDVDRHVVDLRERTLELDRATLDRWWNAFELGDIGVWRYWEQQEAPRMKKAAS